MKWIRRFDHLLTRIETTLLAVLLVGMVLLAATQVLLRNIWSTGIDWADTLLQNATLIVGLLGAMVATSEGRHLSIDLFSRLTRGRVRYSVEFLIDLTALFITGLLAKGGWDTCLANYEPWLAQIPAGLPPAELLRAQVLDGQFPQWLSQACLPVGFAAIAIHFLIRVLCNGHSLVTGVSWQDQSGLSGDALLDDMASKADSPSSDPQDRTSQS